MYCYCMKIFSHAYNENNHSHFRIVLNIKHMLVFDNSSFETTSDSSETYNNWKNNCFKSMDKILENLLWERKTVWTRNPCISFGSISKEQKFPLSFILLFSVPMNNMFS